MEPSDANALHAELVAAFFHPPRVVTCGFEGFADGEVTIVSHVEMWPWRTVVRGSVTRSGSIGDNEGVPSGSKWARQESTWFQEWSLVDDVGTDYHRVGAGRGGDGFCSDFDVRFDTAVPPEAIRLTISTPGRHRIDVPL